MAIRDSKDPSRGAFLFRAHPWNAFLDSVKRRSRPTRESWPPTANREVGHRRSPVRPRNSP
ncbi:DUF397 domain-containing protein [Embleya sp. NPDC056575]|uniref:DUF397 domain-containing protein n=1 Tax=unclassified Embleya TaxID=2699296 RepID=UPI0036A02D9E